MDWLDREIDRRGLRAQVDSILNEIRIEQQLAQLRQKQGLSQRDFARLLGISQPAVAKMESGRVRNFTLETLARSAAVLGGQLHVELRTPGRTARRKRVS